MMDKFYTKSLSTFALCLLLLINAKAQIPGCLDYAQTPVEKWTSVPSIAGIGKFKGLIHYLPPGYNDPANVNKKYPVVIYFHGVAGAVRGNGTNEQLCRLLNADLDALPYQVELGNLVPQGTFSGNIYDYVVIAPQFQTYTYTSPTVNDFPAGDDVELFLNYVKANYRTDNARVYLTGMSSGANIIINYVSSTIQRANLIAAFNTASLCSAVGNYPNLHTAPEVIAASDLPGRMLYCVGDQTACLDTITPGWANRINAINPGLIQLHNAAPCTQFNHNSWGKNYNKDYLVEGTNLFNYFSQFERQSTLPVSLKYFNGKMNSGKVDLEWSTSSEISSARFVIERGGGNYSFTEIASIEAAGNSNTNKVYSFTDSKPLVNLNLYRIVQIDQDGTRKISEIVKVMNKNSGKFNLTVSPNPFTTKVSAFVNLDKKQQVKAVVTDLNGRQVANLTRLCNEGTTELSIPVSNLGKGIYLLKIETDSYSEVQKIVRQ